MERLLSVLKGEAKRAVEGIGANGIFYPTALKLLKKEFGNPLIVCHLNSSIYLSQLQFCFTNLPTKLYKKRFKVNIQQS